MLIGLLLSDEITISEHDRTINITIKIAHPAKEVFTAKLFLSVGVTDCIKLLTEGSLSCIVFTEMGC